MSTNVSGVRSIGEGVCSVAIAINNSQVVLLVCVSLIIFFRPLLHFYI